VYAPAGMTISLSGVNTAGATGVSVGSHKTSTFFPLTASSWLGLASA
jgi:hypothetical protein